MKQLKKYILTLLLTVAALPAFAQSVILDGIEYTCDAETLTACVSKGLYCGGDVTIRGEVTLDDVTYTVTKIDYGAFSDSKYITSLTIPASIVEIESKFDVCNQLTAVHISDLKAWCGIDFYTDLYRYKNISEEIFECSNPLSIAHHLYLDDELITDLSIPDGVDLIESGAFACCDDLTSVSIPNTVTRIAEFAFYDCDNITTVAIGNSVAEIGAYAFKCKKLSTVYCASKIPPVVLSYDVYTVDTYNEEKYTIYDAFTNYDATLYVPVGCKELYSRSAAWSQFRNIEESDKLGEYDDNTVTIDGVQYYLIAGTDTVLARKGADCSGDITIRESVDINGKSYRVTRLSANAFAGCSTVTSIKIPDSVTVIGDYAFKDCRNLVSLSTGNSVTELESTLFQGCSGLKTLSLGKSVKSIGWSPFNDCKNLERVEISDLKAWCGIDFDGEQSNPLYYARFLYLNDELITDLTIPEGLNEIKDYTFIGCANLKSVTIPNSVTKIGGAAFSNCIGLTSVKIGEAVTEIGNGAFFYCKDLTSVVIPDAVIRIGGHAFQSCSLTSVIIGKSVEEIGFEAFSLNIDHNIPDEIVYILKKIYCLNETPPTADYSTWNSTFDNYDATLYVLKGCKDAYKHKAPWSFFKEIVEIDSLGEVGGIEVEGETLPTDYFTLSGIKVATAAPGETPADLPGGTYITRCGTKTSKVIIR